MIVFVNCCISFFFLKFPLLSQLIALSSVSWCYFLPEVTQITPNWAPVKAHTVVWVLVGGVSGSVENFVAHSFKILFAPLISEEFFCTGLGWSRGSNTTTLWRNNYNNIIAVLHPSICLSKTFTLRSTAAVRQNLLSQTSIWFVFACFQIATEWPTRLTSTSTCSLSANHADYSCNGGRCIEIPG